MKKFLLIVLTLSMLLTAIPFSVSAEGDIWDAFYDSIPWDDKNNYIDYDNEDGQKTEGYRPGTIKVFMTEEFMSTHEAPVPTDFNDEKHYIYYDEFIVDIIHKDHYDYNEFDIIIDWFLEPFASSVESTIQGYIYTLKDFEMFKSVEKVQANYVAVKEEELISFEEWSNYDIYYYYNNDDDHKVSGFITDAILFEVSDEFKSYAEKNFETNGFGQYIIEDSIFPELRNVAVSVEIGLLGSGSVVLEKRGEEKRDYTEEHIDAFIEILKCVYNHPLVVSVMPNLMMVDYVDPIDPIIPSDSEEDEKATDTEEETTETEETTLPETTAPETTTPETVNNDSEKTTQKNHQTGDEIYFLMAAAVLSFAVFTFVTTLKKRAKSK